MRLRALIICTLAIQLLTATSALAESCDKVSPRIETHSIQSEQLTPTANCVRITRGKYAINIRKSAGNNFICTPWLEIRTADALIAIQSGSKFCQVVVLRGNATIKNILEKHIVRVSTNGVYQSRRQEKQSEVSSPSGKPLVLENLIDLRSERPLFSTARSLTTIGTLSGSSLHSSSFGPYAGAPADGGKPNTKIAAIISPPTLLSYEVGPDVEKTMPIQPELLHNFPPEGIINRPETHLAGESQLSL